MTNPKIARKISRLYVLALTAVALLSVGGQVLVQRSLKSQLTDARVINIAGRQRMLSQKICKTLLLLAYPPGGTQPTTYVADLDAALALWASCHAGLQQGYLQDVGIEVKNSAAIRQMFTQIHPLFHKMHDQASQVSRYYHGHQQAAGSAVAAKVNQVLEAERAYLDAMDRIVFQYDAEAVIRINESRRIEYVLLGCTLVVLVLEGAFIFRPAVHQIRQTISLLVDAQQQGQRVNEELVLVNHSLEAAREALVEAMHQKHRQEINEQKLRSAYLIEGQEEERKRVAREIHDGLGQMLTALKYGIEKISDVVPDTAAAQHNLADLRQLVSQTMTEARTISFNLMPAVLSDFGLSSALKMLTAQVASGSDTVISFTSDWNGQRLPKNVEIGLYRVGQEAIHNAVKYAGAKEIRVSLTAKKKIIQLDVMDNGRGFRYDGKQPPSHAPGRNQGISNMKERVFMMNGQIDIVTKPGRGTRINIKVPVIAVA